MNGWVWVFVLDLFELEGRNEATTSTMPKGNLFVSVYNLLGTCLCALVNTFATTYNNNFCIELFR